MEDDNQGNGWKSSRKVLRQYLKQLEAETKRNRKRQERENTATNKHYVTLLLQQEPGHRRDLISQIREKTVPEARTEMIRQLIGRLAVSTTTNAIVTVVDTLVEIGPEVVPLVNECLKSYKKRQQCLGLHGVIMRLAGQLSEDALMRVLESLEVGARRYGGDTHLHEAHDRVVAKIDQALNALS